MITTDRRHTLAPVSPVNRHLPLPLPLATASPGAHVIPNRLKLFGGGMLANAAGPITGRAAQRHRIALLALLATTRRLYRSRDQLIAFLWPDADAERGRKLLSDSIYRVNRALDGDVITGTGDDLRLNRGILGSDVADFEAAVDARDWQRVAELYTGPLLDGFFVPGSPEFDHWMETERAQYARTYGKALESLAVKAGDAGQAAEAVDWWHRLAALVPDDSRVAMELMRALESSGNRARALSHAREHALYLRESLGVQPDSAVQQLAEQLATPAESGAITGTIAPRGANAIAVLPFQNVSESETTSYFADGVSEELMYLLTRTPGLRVASRTSSFAYRDVKVDAREVGRRLHVDWILEGSIRRSGDTLRIAAHLTDARNGYQVWSDSFDRSSSDVFAIQAEIAATIATRIAPSLNGAVAPSTPPIVRSARDADTRDLDFQARFQFHKRTEANLRKAVELFERVVAREAEHTRAWAGLAETYAVLAFYDFMAPRIAFPRAESAANQAIHLDPGLAGPHATLGCVDTFYHWNWESAEQRFRHAIELEPTNSTARHFYASMLATRGRFAEAEREMRHAADLDPLSMIAHSSIGWILVMANQNERAIRQLHVALQFNPNFCLANYWMGLALQQNEQSSDAIAYLLRSIELAPDSTLQRAALAHAYASAGDSGTARQVLDDLLAMEENGRYISSYQLAKVHVALGESSAALTRLERAHADRAHAMTYLTVDPQLRSLAGHPRVRRLIEQVDQPFGAQRESA
jgi:TolB-like protein/Flp pilus assembly protein TadD